MKSAVGHTGEGVSANCEPAFKHLHGAIHTDSEPAKSLQHAQHMDVLPSYTIHHYVQVGEEDK